MTTAWPRNAGIEAQAAAPSTRRCAVPGCGKPAHPLARPETRGLPLCPKHLAQRRRHGSALRKSFSKAELAPYQRGAKRCLKANREQPMVLRVVAALDGLMKNAGEAESAWSLRGLSPAKRARITLAKLRDKGITGEKLLEIVLTIWTVCKSEWLTERDREFRQVQIAKIAHRLVSGSRVTRGARPVPMPAKHQYSSGVVLRHLGSSLDDVASLVAEPAAEEILARMEARRARGRKAGRGPAAPDQSSIWNAFGTCPPLYGREAPGSTQAGPQGAGMSEEKRTEPPDQGCCPLGGAAGGGGDDEDGIGQSPLPPAIFHDPWLTAEGPALRSITAEVLRLTSEADSSVPSPSSPITTEPSPEAAERADLVRRHGRHKGNRMADHRASMRKEAARLARPQRRPRRQTAADAQRWQKVAGNLVANIALLHLTEPVGTRIAVNTGHTKQTRYDAPGFGQLPRLLTTLADKGVLIRYPAVFKRQRTTVEPSAAFRSALDQLGASLADLRRAGGEETIILRDRTARRWHRGDHNGDGARYNLPPVHYADTEETRRLRAEMEEINLALATADITMLDHEGRPNADHMPQRCRPPLYRSFLTIVPQGPHTFDLGGRIWGGFWQTLSGPDRPNPQRHLLRLNGEPVADLDFSAMFPRLAYHRLGIEYPSDRDPYMLPGLAAHRSGVKSALNALLSAPAPIKSLPRKIKALLPREWTAARITSALADHHQPLAPLFGTDIGVRLMHTESSLLVAVLLSLARLGIPALPMHDGIMVARSRWETARAIMGADSERLLGGLRLPVEEKPVALPPEASLSSQCDRAPALGPLGEAPWS